MFNFDALRSAGCAPRRPLAFRAGWPVVLALVFGGGLALPSLAQTAQAVNPSTVEAQVKKFGVGKDVKVTLAGGEKLRGHITRIGANSFTVKLRKSTTEQQVPYNRVVLVKDPGPVFWILIGAAIAVIIIAVVH